MSEDSLSSSWWLYILECKDGAFYTGIAVDVDERYRQHCAGKGARYTRMNPPVRIVTRQAFPDRGSATRAEVMVKRMSRIEKIEWINSAALQEGAIK